MSLPAPFRRKKTPAEDPAIVLVPRGPGWVSFGITSFFLTLILLLCWHFATLLIAQTNQQLGPSKDAVTGKVKGDQDQKHNLNRALQTRRLLRADPDKGIHENFQRWLPHETDGVVAPLWPWVAARLASSAHIYDETHVSDEDLGLFERGKWLNVIICMVFLWALGLVAAKTFSPGAAVCVLLLAAFAVLIPRAVYFQPEPLYYLFFFLAWICAIKLLTRNPVLLYALFGVLAGLAWLAKTSVEPMVLGWLAVTGWRFVGRFFSKESGLEEPAWSGRRHFIGLIVFALSWCAIAGPRYAAASQRWGDARFSYPGVWIWFDNFEDGFTWMNAHPDKAALDSIPEDERPSFRLYRTTHTLDQMKERLVDGTQDKVARFFAPKRVAPKKDGTFSGWKFLLQDRGVYLGVLGGIVLLAGAAFLSRRPKEGHPDHLLPGGTGAIVFFIAATFCGYALLYGWYSPIGRGDRFMLSLYLPLAFSLVWGAEGLMKYAGSRGTAKWLPWVYHSTVWMLNAAIAWQLIEVMRNPVFDPGTQ